MNHARALALRGHRKARRERWRMTLELARAAGTMDRLVALEQRRDAERIEGVV